MSGIPERLKSTYDRVAESANPSCRSLPASSSMWMRVRPISRTPSPSTSMPTLPCSASGSSYWLIWYPFGRSG